MQLSQTFQQQYFNDNNKWRLILGSSPARRDSAITAIPFEDVQNLQKETGIAIANFHVSNASSTFLSRVINKYEGKEQILL